MSKRGQLTIVAVAASGISALGLFTGPGIAQAEACEYEFPNILQIKTDAPPFEPDGRTYQVPVSGSPRRTVGPSKAMAAVIGFQEGSFGTPYGGMNGNSINFTINFDSGPAKGSTAAFQGQIDPDGFASGTVTPGGFNWRSTEKMSCVYKPPVVEAPKPAPAPAPAQSANHMFTLTGDVDKYKHPGGNDEDKLPGFVEGGPGSPQVNLIGCQKDNWCQIAIPPNNDFVWVWGEFVPPEARS